MQNIFFPHTVSLLGIYSKKLKNVLEGKKSLVLYYHSLTRHIHSSSLLLSSSTYIPTRKRKRKTGITLLYGLFMQYQSMFTASEPANQPKICKSRRKAIKMEKQS